LMVKTWRLNSSEQSPGRKCVTMKAGKSFP
jgi:hypothetical protein